MQRANKAARILWPKLWVRVRREPFNRNELCFVSKRKTDEKKGTVTSSRACPMPSACCATSNASTLPVSMTSGITLAAMRTAMKIDAIGSKPVQP